MLVIGRQKELYQVQHTEVQYTEVQYTVSANSSVAKEPPASEYSGELIDLLAGHNGHGLVDDLKHLLTIPCN